MKRLLVMVTGAMVLGAVLAKGNDRAAAAARRVAPALKKDFRTAGLRWGSPVYLRAFKEELKLEMWVQKEARYQLFRTYDIASISGVLGPKLAEGDGQTPEGFYYFRESALNPKSSYHLSFNIGYPNAYDRAKGRTGSLIMVHGSNVSIGCYAMTNARIEEIYTLVSSAFTGGQKFIRFHSFPFRMTSERMKRAKGSEHEAFWKNLGEGYGVFERTQVPPNVEVRGGRYVFE